MTHPPIPPGWRLLGPDEVIENNTDQCFFADSSYAKKWEPVLVFGGATPNKGKHDGVFDTKQWVFIRQDTIEKEWLNPWD